MRKFLLTLLALSCAGSAFAFPDGGYNEGDASVQGSLTVTDPDADYPVAIEDGYIKLGDGWVQYSDSTSELQFSNDAGVNWAAFGSGGGNVTGSVVKVDGTALSTANFIDSSDINATASGSSVTLALTTTASNNIAKGVTAYGWGNHSAAGYLTDAPIDGTQYARKDGNWTTVSVVSVETDPVYANSTAHSISAENITRWDSALQNETDTLASVTARGTATTSGVTLGASTPAAARFNVLGNGVSAKNFTAFVPSAQQLSQSVVIEGNGSAWFVGRDNANGNEFGAGQSVNGNSFVGSLTNQSLELRSANVARVTINGTSGNAAFANNVTVVGNTGFGTTAPTSVVDVVGANSDLVSIQNVNQSSYSRIKFVGNKTYTVGVGGKNETTYGLADKFYVFDVNATAPRIVVASGGNVGIGTTAPTSKLNVVGNVAATGADIATINATSVSATNLRVGTSTTSGYVLTADSGGNATWQAASGGSSGVSTVAVSYPYPALQYSVSSKKTLWANSGNGMNFTSVYTEMRLNNTYNVSAQLNSNLYYADQDGANQYLICALDTTNGTSTVTNFSNGNVPSGKRVYEKWDDAPAFDVDEENHVFNYTRVQ